MNPIRVFAKLAARVPPFDLQPGAAGSPDMDAATAAALCAGMSERAYKAALARHSHDESVRQWLTIEIWRSAIEKARRDNWGTAGKKVARCGNRACLNLATVLSAAPLANLDDAITVTDRADYPRVVAEVIIRETYHPGFWAQADSWQWRAAMLGVGKSIYFSAWHKRVQSIGSVMDNWVGEAERHVWKRQTG